MIIDVLNKNKKLIFETMDEVLLTGNTKKLTFSSNGTCISFIMSLYNCDIPLDWNSMIFECGSDSKVRVDIKEELVS